MKIKYRPGQPADIAEIVSLVQAAIENMNRQNINQWDALYPTEADFRDDIEKGQLYVGIMDEKIAVIYVLNRECDEAYQNGAWQYPSASFCVIHRLCVNPDFQNRGVGALTMEHIEKELATRGIQAIRLDAFSQNPYAIKLYKGLGYQVVGHADWRKGRFFLMEKCLDNGQLVFVKDFLEKGDDR
ncbi:MAG: GNAT family N-acetyltransferase [Lachnospiraceae bacterium]